MNAVPNSVDALLVIQTLENTVAADHEEIEVVLELEHLDLWLADDDVLVSTVLGPLGLDIAEGTRYRKPSRKHSQRPLHIEVLFLGCRGCLGECLSSVNFTTGSLYSDALLLIIGLMVS